METFFTLYKGKVKGKFLGPTDENPNRHLYYINGKAKTGVSTPSGVKFDISQLMGWQSEEIAKELFTLLKKKQQITESAIARAAFAGEIAKKKAGDLGTQAHDWIEQYIKHKLGLGGYKKMPEMPDDNNVARGVTSFLEWESEHKVKYLWSEKILYSLKYDYIGRGDFAAKVDGKVCLCDIKTGNSLRMSSVRMQTSAYAMADREESKVKYDGRCAIRISKESEDEYYERCKMKNHIRELLGKNTYEPRKYEVFEYKFLDEKKSDMKQDYESFLKSWDLLRYTKAVDGYNGS